MQAKLLHEGLMEKLVWRPRYEQEDDIKVAET
jgi:hypothetical protein